MARPRYGKGDDTARDKLEAAFWDALAIKPYEDISVVGLCRAAGVNKNTFYYHFSNIDELARSAAESLVETQFIHTAMETIKGDSWLPDDFLTNEFTTQLDRVCLLADDKAPAHLRRKLHDAVMGMWKTEMGIDADEMSLRDRVSLEFVLGGFLGVFAFRNREGGEFVLKDVWGADYIPHAYSIMNNLAKTGR